MNVFWNDSVFFSLKNEDISCFYFSSHFYESFEKKQTINEMCVLNSVRKKEIITYCLQCKEKI